MITFKENGAAGRIVSATAPVGASVASTLRARPFDNGLTQKGRPGLFVEPPFLKTKKRTLDKGSLLKEKWRGREDSNHRPLDS